MTRAKTAVSASPARHALAVLLLPFTNTVLIPAGVAIATGRWSVGWLHEPSVADVALLALTGAAFATGAWLVVHAIALFVRIGGGTLAPWDPTHSLVAEGAYRYSRNPMKTGLFLVLLAEAIFVRSPPLFAWFALFAAANAIYIRVSEEPGLRRRFGVPYEEYCERVPRWLPSLRRVRAPMLHGEAS